MIDLTALEAAARAQCASGGFNPDDMMPNDGPRWKYYVPGVEAAITAYLAALGAEPRWWAVEDEYGFVEVYSTEARAQKAAERLSSVGEVYPLYAAPAKPGMVADYFGSLVEKSRASAEKASRKFPQPNYVALKIAEEAGEVVRGCVHYAEGRMGWAEVESEIVQLLAMLIRLVTEGDQINGVTPPAMLAAAKEA